MCRPCALLGAGVGRFWALLDVGVCRGAEVVLVAWLRGVVVWYW